MKTTVTVQVREEILKGLLVTVVESGWSRSWFAFSGVERDSELNILNVRVTDIQGDTPKSWTVTPATMLRGLRRLGERMGVERTEEPWHLSPWGAGRHLTDAITENGDAITADIVLQMGVFGEVLYG